MATSLTELANFLNEERLRYTMMEDHVRLSFTTEYYVAPDGERNIFLVLKPEESGEYFKLIAPNLYRYQQGLSSQAIFQALLQVSWKTKMVQFEYDDADGEIRSVIEFPLEDGLLTRRQLMRAINGMIQIIEEYHPVLDEALQDGIVDFMLEEEVEAQKLARDALSGIRPPRIQLALKKRALKLEE